MSVCTFLAADTPLPEVTPSQEYPCHIRMENGVVTIEDGGADDNYFLKHFRDVSCYTDRKHGVHLEWHYTDGRAKQLIAYIKTALQHTDVVELWHIWLGDYYDFEDSPVIHRQTISVDKLTAEDIKDIDSAKLWNTPDKQYPNRPSFYCLTITP